MRNEQEHRQPSAPVVEIADNLNGQHILAIQDHTGNVRVRGDLKAFSHAQLLEKLQKEFPGCQLIGAGYLTINRKDGVVLVTNSSSFPGKILSGELLDTIVSWLQAEKGVEKITLAHVSAG